MNTRKTRSTAHKSANAAGATQLRSYAMLDPTAERKGPSAAEARALLDRIAAIRSHVEAAVKAAEALHDELPEPEGEYDVYGSVGAALVQFLDETEAAKLYLTADRECSYCAIVRVEQIAAGRPDPGAEGGTEELVKAAVAALGDTVSNEEATAFRERFCERLGVVE